MRLCFFAFDEKGPFLNLKKSCIINGLESSYIFKCKIPCQENVSLPKQKIVSFSSERHFSMRKIRCESVPVKFHKIPEYPNKISN